MGLKWVKSGTGLLLSCGAGVFLSVGSVQADDVTTQLQLRRQNVLSAAQKGSAALPVLTAAMKDSNAMIRRAAVRSMGQIGLAAENALIDAFKNDSDALVRRTALRALLDLEGAQVLKVLEPAMGDSSDLVRASAIGALAEMRPQTEQIVALLKKAQQDSSPEVSQIASQALWPFHKEGVSLREKPEFKDSQLAVAQTIPLAENGWRFKTDAGQIGQEKNWFGVDFKDNDWQTISIGQAWEGQIDQPYDGAAWYRHTFTLPEKPAQSGTDIVFDAVDESAWVWINGQYVGQHDIGMGGWNLRFGMDVTEYLKWGQENQITVRVLDRTMAGGIWKPVYFEVLKR